MICGTPPRWSRLSPEELQSRLAGLGLVINSPEQTVICSKCQYALQPKGECVVRHLADKHQVPKGLRTGLAAYIQFLRLPDPNTLPLRPDRSEPHRHLVCQAGFACKYCEYRTVSGDLIVRHLSKEHNRRGARMKKIWLQDEVHCNIILQSWTQNGARGFWIAVPADSQPSGAHNPTRPRITLGPIDQDRAAILRQIHQAEQDHIQRQAAGQQDFDGDSAPDLAMQTNWMRRTGWQQMLKGARHRDILVGMATMPTNGGAHCFGFCADGTEVRSSAEDEMKLCRMVTALDQIRRRCEDTVRHTDGSIRRWLRSTRPHSAYEKPFELVAQESTSIRYWRLLQRFFCFAFRLWRLSRSIRRSLCGRSLTQSQCDALSAAWNIFSREQLPASSTMRTTVSKESEVDTGDESDEGEYDKDREQSDGDADQDSDEDYEQSEEESEQENEEQDGGKGVIVPTGSLGYLLRLAAFFVTEPFENGRADSTLLIYFSGVLGINEDGVTFLRPRHYTPKLSGLIYCARLLVLELTLPRFAYHEVGITARPRYSQLECLNAVRTTALCIGSQAPVSELLSLRDYGRVLAGSEGPVFRVCWTDDGKLLSWDDGQISMDQFRGLSGTLVDRVSSASYRLMYGWQPDLDLHSVHDRMATYDCDYSFLSDKRNNLAGAYLDLSERACVAEIDGLVGTTGWDCNAVKKYLALHDEVLLDILVLIHLTGGQAPRGTELLCLEHRNSSSTSRGVYVYEGSVVLISRHSKARTITNREFQVMRALPDIVGRLLFQYLVYIRPFAYMLRRHCWNQKLNPSLLFPSAQNPEKPWPSRILSKALRQLSSSVLGCSIGIQTYRQLSIAITEKHIKQISKPFNPNDDWSKDANPTAAFAWQSGHRPMQRVTTYGLDRAFPDNLQPALLQLYQWVSIQWNLFLQKKDTASISGPSTHGKRQRDELDVHSVSKRRLLLESRSSTDAPPTCPETFSLNDSTTDTESPGGNRGSAGLVTNFANDAMTDPETSPNSPISADIQARLMARVPQSESWNTILPLVHLPTYHVVVCMECKYACLADEIRSHLRELHPGIPTAEKSLICQNVQGIQGLIKSQEELRNFSFPSPHVAPIPFLELQCDGLGCTICRFVCRNEKHMKKHCRTVHRWKNPLKQGGQNKSIQVEMPWRVGLQCQRFFRKRYASNWFEVNRPL